MKDYIDILEYAYEKLNHTLCLNQNEGNLKFGIDAKGEQIDCKDADEMVDCLEIIEEALCRFRRLSNTCVESFVKIKEIIGGDK